MIKPPPGVVIYGEREFLAEEARAFRVLCEEHGIDLRYTSRAEARRTLARLASRPHWAAS